MLYIIEIEANNLAVLKISLVYAAAVWFDIYKLIAFSMIIKAEKSLSFIVSFTINVQSMLAANAAQGSQWIY
jgi:hypothetical protein